MPDPQSVLEGKILMKTFINEAGKLPAFQVVADLKCCHVSLWQQCREPVSYSSRHWMDVVQEAFYMTKETKSGVPSCFSRGPQNKVQDTQGIGTKPRVLSPVD